MAAADSHGAGIFSVSGPRFPAPSQPGDCTQHSPLAGTLEIQIQGAVGIHNYRYRGLIGDTDTDL